GEGWWLPGPGQGAAGRERSRGAMRWAAPPPAVVKLPPAIRSPLDATARAKTLLSIPVPRADHAEPFQRAMWFAATPPAAVKSPPATTSPLGSAASALTSGAESAGSPAAQGAPVRAVPPPAFL